MFGSGGVSVFGESWLEYTRNLEGDIRVWNRRGDQVASGRQRRRPLLGRLRDPFSLLPVEVVDPAGQPLLDLTSGPNDRLRVERNGTTVVGEISWAKGYVFALYAAGECVAIIKPVPDARWWRAFPGDFAVEGAENANLGAVTRPRYGRSGLRSRAFVLDLQAPIEDPLRTLVFAAPFVMSRALEVELVKSQVAGFTS